MASDMNCGPSKGPNLFLVGAQKCGTTSLYEYLRQHPQIFFPRSKSEDNYWRMKEPNHFCPDSAMPENQAVKSRSDYLALFADSMHYAWRGDASPTYLFFESSANAIKEFCPDARVLIMLRPPIQMMRSAYRRLRMAGKEDIDDFHEAVAASVDRRNGRRVPGRCDVPAWLDYRGESQFAPQVERYQRLFGTDAVKVVLLEDMTANPRQVYLDILEFLEVDASFVPEFRVHNEAPRHGVLEHFLTTAYALPGVKQVARHLFPYPVRRKYLCQVRSIDERHIKPDPQEEELRELCRPDIERLSKLLGRDLSHWV